MIGSPVPNLGVGELPMRACIRIALLLVVASAGFVFGQQKPPEDLQPVIAALDKEATEMAQDPKAASFTLGLVRPTGLVWSKSYGYADIAAKKPATADTVYRIGSITKQFTALMLLQLVHEGKVHLSDPVEKYFPEIHLVQNDYKTAAPITFWQLATHTSGLATEPEPMETYVKGALKDWEKTLIAALPHTKFEYEPGTRFNYSNIGYAVLGAALARAAHQPYIDYVKQKILLPLGMTHSDFIATPEVRGHLATGYDVLIAGHWDEETPIRELDGRGYKVPNGGLFTTIDDLARFVAFEMLGGPESVLPRKELEESQLRIIGTDRSMTRGRALGATLVTLSGHVFIGHSGGVSGYSATAFFQPDAETGIIVLRNESALGMDKLVRVFAQTLPVKPAPEDQRPF
jgi:CubicO group peptidase (beta-lactamase class C family)